MYRAFVLIFLGLCPAILFSQTPDTTGKKLQQQIDEVSREIDSLKTKAVAQSELAESFVNDLQKVQDRLQKVRKAKAQSGQTPDQKKQEDELVQQYKSLSKKRQDALHEFDKTLVRLDERVGFLEELKKRMVTKSDK